MDACFNRSVICMLRQPFQTGRKNLRKLLIVFSIPLSYHRKRDMGLLSRNVKEALKNYCARSCCVEIRLKMLIYIL